MSPNNRVEQNRRPALREAIFGGDADQDCFLNTLAQACQKTAWQVHAFCLMENHFHLAVETPQPNLVDGMKWLLGTLPAVSIAGTASLAISSADVTKPRAERVLAQESARIGWSELDLLGRRKGHPGKLKLAFTRSL